LRLISLVSMSSKVVLHCKHKNEASAPTACFLLHPRFNLFSVIHSSSKQKIDGVCLKKQWVCINISQHVDSSCVEQLTSWNLLVLLFNLMFGQNHDLFKLLATGSFPVVLHNKMLAGPRSCQEHQVASLKVVVKNGTDQSPTKNGCPRVLGTFQTTAYNSAVYGRYLVVYLLYCSGRFNSRWRGSLAVIFRPKHPVNLLDPNR